MELNIDKIAESLNTYYGDEDLESLKLIDLKEMILSLEEYMELEEHLDSRHLQLVFEAWLELKAH